MVVLCFDPTDVPRGRGYWKFNNSLLSDLAYIDLINSLIERYKQDPSVLNADPVFMWENLKFKIRAETIFYSKRKATQSRNYERFLISHISKLESDIFNGMAPNSQDDLENAREKLHMLYKNKLEGIIVRSRARWVEEGETNSKYFFNLEKRNRRLSTIYELLNKDGVLMNDASQILDEIRSFYTSLYSSRHCSSTPFFDNLPGFHSDLDFTSCEGYLTIEECRVALLSMTNGKSPGSDGFSIDFYKFFGLLFKTLSLVR
ncbi:hypothetical protein HOLleu_19620 [Holothuria leucospilota]|uniref:Uncharacterized protein n=1 Tax=Holothuria leucospilota TaxID=206669 RepID=A0A9Q1C074_HOLLE|nr:hypothetical protein HOLleu_19620 [Holothuria leucospilota]